MIGVVLTITFISERRITLKTEFSPTSKGQMQKQLSNLTYSIHVRSENDRVILKFK